jgi:hypothetical protein
VDGLRDECERVRAEFGGSLGSGAATDKLYRLDSCIRESMRVSGFNTVALMREVWIFPSIFPRQPVIPRPFFLFYRILIPITRYLRLMVLN